MKNFQETKGMYAKFMRNCGKEDRLNKFSFELLRDKDFRMQMRTKRMRKKFNELQWTDDHLLNNINELGVLKTCCFERFGDDNFILFFSDFNKFRVSVNEAKRSKYIAYSREGHPNVREKASVLYLKSLKNTGLQIPEKVANRLCELFADKWKAYIEQHDYTLHINRDFERIYDSEKCEGDFNSCMEDRGLWEMYANHTNKECHAAYLTNSEDKVVARAILWDNVRDRAGNSYRYLDRQYSTDCKRELQQILIDMCIAQDKIDLYKPVGCSCSDADNIVNLKGERFKGRLKVTLNLDYGDPVCYLDTFKWYDIEDYVAYSNGDVVYTHLLDSTDGELRDAHEGEVWSDYHDDWINEDDAVYCEDDDGYYYSNDDCICWPVDMDGAYLVDNCTYTYDTNEYYYNTDSLYCTADTGEYYAECDDLYFCDSNDCWYANDYYLRYSDMHNVYLHEVDAIWIEDIQDWDYMCNEDEYIRRRNGLYYTKIKTKNKRKLQRQENTTNRKFLSYDGETLITRTQAIKILFAGDLDADGKMRRYKAIQNIIAKDYSEISLCTNVYELIR